MRVSTRNIVLGIIAAGALGGGLWFAARPVPAPVDMVAAQKAALEVTVNADGVTRIRDVYDVSAPVSGLALRSPVSVGDPVTAGETVVAVVEPGEPGFLDARSLSQAAAAVSEAEAALHLAETNILRAEADLEYATNQLERAQTLFNRGAAAQSTLDDAKLAVRLREATLQSAMAERDMRQSTLERQRAMLIQPTSNGAGGDSATCCFPITAPVTGRVLSISNMSQRMVAAGTPLLTIGTVDDLEVVVDLLSADAVRIAAGSPAYVERWGGAPLMAKVREIEPAAFTKISALGIEEQRVKVALDFVTPADERAALGHGFRVFVRIVEWHDDEVLQVPISALFRQGDDWAVFTERAGFASLRIVEIGRRNADFAQILSGLSAGEKVIIHPSDKIADGVMVIDRAEL